MDGNICCKSFFVWFYFCLAYRTKCVDRNTCNPVQVILCIFYISSFMVGNIEIM